MSEAAESEAAESERLEIEPLLDAALLRVEALRSAADQARATMPDRWAALIDELLHELGASFEELRATVEDLTEKSQLLADSRRRYEDLFHLTADGLLVTDAAGVVREANAQVAAMLATTPEHLVGKPLVLLVSRRDRHLLHSVLAKLQEGAPRARLDVVVERRDGTSFPGSLHARSGGTSEGTSDGRAMLRWALRDDTERAVLQERLVFHSRHDSLTGLLNRACFVEGLQAALDAGQEGDDDALAVLFVDLDRFKTVNDRLGHSAGDRLLGVVASRIREVVRDDDLVGRLGGDEFAVAVRVGADAAEALQLAHRLRGALSEPFVVGGARAVVGATVGIALAGRDPVGAESLLGRADQAMYDAKRAGGGRVQVYDVRLERAVARQVQTEAGLRTALGDGRFRLRYQPLVSLTDGRMLGVEALVRWEQHLGAKPLAAAAFVGVAEECGVLTSIDAWVVRQACRDAVAWRELGLASAFTVGVNVSSSDLADPGFEASLVGVLDDVGLDPAGLCLEVTEGSALDALGVAESVLTRLHDRGIKIAIDDFGTGYSALSYLRKLPIDLVKIDKSFVERLPAMREDRLIVASVVGLAEVIGFEVVAEGVEHPEQVDALLSGGCTRAQGHLLSVPVSADELAGMIGRGWRADVG